jgi:hypothetical protein
MSFLRRAWEGWKKAAFALGNFITAVVMTVFYFTIFALFAIPFSLSKANVFVGRKAPEPKWFRRGEKTGEWKDFLTE